MASDSASAWTGDVAAARVVIVTSLFRCRHQKSFVAAAGARTKFALAAAAAPAAAGVGELINPFIRDEVVTPADRFAFGNRSGRDGVPPGNAMRDRRSRRR